MSEMSAPTRVLDYAGSAPLDAVVRRLSRLAVAAFILSGLSVGILFHQREIGSDLLSALGGEKYFFTDNLEAFNRMCVTLGAPVVASLIIGGVALLRIVRRDSGLRGTVLAVASIIVCVAALVVLMFVRSRAFENSPGCGCKSEPRYPGAVN
jgi:hypothetical protein